MDAAPPGSESDLLRDPPLGEQAQLQPGLSPACQQEGRLWWGARGPGSRIASHSATSTLQQPLPDAPGLEQGQDTALPWAQQTPAAVTYGGPHLHPKEDAGGGGAGWTQGPQLTTLALLLGR